MTIAINHVFSTLSFIGFVLVSIPFIWHLESLNTGTCLFMFWVALSNLTFFINSIIWDGNVVDWSPIWCDIAIRVDIAVNVGIPAAALCIQRRLYHIISNPINIATRAERRRWIITDATICLVLPMSNVIFAYIVQERRYDIFEDIGCSAAFVHTSVGLVLIPGWPLAVGLVSGVYGCLNVYHLWNKRQAIRSILSSSASIMNFGCYLRLLLLSGMDILCTVLFGVWGLKFWFPIIPWQGWAAVHAKDSQVEQFPASSWRNDRNCVGSLEMTRWVRVLCAFIFFAFFGLGGEAKRHYELAMQFIIQRIRFQVHTTQSSADIPKFGVSEADDMVSSTHGTVRSALPETQSPTSEKINPLEPSEGPIFSTPEPSILHRDSRFEYEFARAASKNSGEPLQSLPSTQHTSFLSYFRRGKVDPS